MRNKPKIFVDTAIFRYAASVKLVQSAKLQAGTITSKCGERRDATFLVYENEVKEIEEADICLEREKVAIKKIADLACCGSIDLVYSHEVNLELLFQPEVDLAIGRMMGSPCHIIHSPLLKVTQENFNGNDTSEFPFKFWGNDKASAESTIYEKVENEFFRLPVGCFHSRLNFRSGIVGLRETQGLKVNASKLMHPFLMSIDNIRFQEILKLLNISSVGSDKRNNLYLDAYHLWSAEESNCEYFLTTDRPLVNQFKGSVTEAIRPTNLVDLL
ncbi:MAG: hypothetical protein HOP34_14920 [Methylococcaceae bacterium]|nr:hypothetical protein [Methylococcaceae bacterium]